MPKMAAISDEKTYDTASRGLRLLEAVRDGLQRS
jgi:hypothetical protein